MNFIFKCSQNVSTLHWSAGNLVLAENHRLRCLCKLMNHRGGGKLHAVSLCVREATSRETHTKSLTVSILTYNKGCVLY